MRTNTFILHKDYTRFPQNYQLVLSLEGVDKNSELLLFS